MKKLFNLISIFTFVASKPHTGYYWMQDGVLAAGSAPVADVAVKRGNTVSGRLYLTGTVGDQQPVVLADEVLRFFSKEFLPSIPKVVNAPNAFEKSREAVKILITASERAARTLKQYEKFLIQTTGNF